ncbi:hypothetical protein RIVM261_042560 [Rivularia sp. IAM M-261]|nr:hypothetical protein RIVM261_042560 [Rivularia sp. IAM M-261]
MAQCKENRVKLSYFLSKFSHYGLTALLSVVLLSESVGARATLTQLQLAQQPATTQVDATRAEAERLTQEGAQLYKQGTAESLVAAIQKWEAALVLWQKLGDKQWQAGTLNLCRLQRLQRMQIKPLTLLSFSTTYRVVT